MERVVYGDVSVEAWARDYAGTPQACSDRYPDGGALARSVTLRAPAPLQVIIGATAGWPAAAWTLESLADGWGPLKFRVGDDEVWGCREYRAECGVVVRTTRL